MLEKVSGACSGDEGFYVLATNQCGCSTSNVSSDCFQGEKGACQSTCCPHPGCWKGWIYGGRKRHYMGFSFSISASQLKCALKPGGCRAFPVLDPVLAGICCLVLKLLDAEGLWRGGEGGCHSDLSLRRLLCISQLWALKTGAAGLRGVTHSGSSVVCCFCSP